jgi:hypothetical protein
LPAAVFKVVCADFKKRFPRYPSFFRQMFTDTQANIEIQSKLLDLKSKKLGVKRGGFDEANERYKVPD